MTSLPTEGKSNNYVFGKRLGRVPVTWVDATISGVARQTGGAANRLAYIGDFSKELPDEEGFFSAARRRGGAKKAFLLGTFSDFDTYQRMVIPILLFRNRHARDLRLADIFLGTILG